MALTLDQANAIALAALAAGAEEQVFALSVVVTDPGGCLRCAMRADGVGNFGIDIALGKAVTALGFGMSSAGIASLLGGNQAAVAGLIGATGGRFLPIGGGVLMTDASGVLLGAAAVAGSSPDNDARFATAGVRAAGLLVVDE